MPAMQTAGSMLGTGSQIVKDTETRHARLTLDKAHATMQGRKVARVPPSWLAAGETRPQGEGCTDSMSSVTIFVERGDLDRALRQLRKQREGVVSTYERNERGFLSRGERRRMAERKARRKMRRRLAKERARMQSR